MTSIVKPLEWEEGFRAGWKRGRVVGMSPTQKTEATIFRINAGWQYMGDVYLTAHDSLDGALHRAKAAAQADYERRILSALTTDPQALVAAAYEAAATTDPDIRGEIVEAGARRFRNYSRGVRGQTFTEWDCLETHVIEAYADRIHTMIDQPARSALDRVIAEAKAEEREACAEIAAGYAGSWEDSEGDAGLVIAAAIRARGEEG